jgi:hypothetical protein
MCMHAAGAGDSTNFCPPWHLLFHTMFLPTKSPPREVVKYKIVNAVTRVTYHNNKVTDSPHEVVEGDVL